MEPQLINQFSGVKLKTLPHINSEFQKRKGNCSIDDGHDI